MRLSRFRADAVHAARGHELAILCPQSQRVDASFIKGLRHFPRSHVAGSNLHSNGGTNLRHRHAGQPNCQVASGNQPSYCISTHATPIHEPSVYLESSMNTKPNALTYAPVQPDVRRMMVVDVLVRQCFRLNLWRPARLRTRG